MSDNPTLLFRVGGHRHAARLDDVEGVARADCVRSVPQPPPFVVGVMDRGEETVPVVDLAALLELAPLDSGRSKHVILHRSPWGVVGFLVEEAAGVKPANYRSLPANILRPGGALCGLADTDGATAYLLDLDAAVPQGMQVGASPS